MLPVDQAQDGFTLIAAGADVQALTVFSSLAHAHHPVVYEGMARASANLGQVDHAIGWIDRGLRCFPGHAGLRYYRSLLLLGLGLFAGGWPDYELRLKGPQAQYLPRRITFPRWTGEPLREKKILLWTEQGFGDEIMFGSLITRLTRQGAAVTLECSRETAPLFRRSLGHVIEVITRDFDGGMSRDAHGRYFDFESPLASIARYTVPDPASLMPRAWLVPNDENVRTTRAALLATGQNGFHWKKIVGVSWRGGTVATRRAARSIDLEQLAPLFDTPGILFLSLQHDATEKELSPCPHLGRNFIHWYTVRQLDGLATLIGACDSVVTVCNTNVHLAGAMGKKVRVLAPLSPEWRYGFAGAFEGDAMPWYPNVKVFRQTKYNEWRPVIERAARLLAMGCL